jgi:hypothetical protein
MILEVQYLQHCIIKSQVLIFQLARLIPPIEEDTSIGSVTEVLEMTLVASKEGMLDLREIIGYDICCISQEKGPVEDT